MTTPDIVANMSRGWNRDPVGVVLGTERTGVSAALWTHGGDDVQEVWAAADATRHIVCLQLSSHSAEMFLDGRKAFRHRFYPGQINLVPAGRQPRAVTTGPLRVLHLYVPTMMISRLQAAEEWGRAAELVGSKLDRDPAIERIGREVLFEMRAGQPLSRMRIDALGQDLAVQLVRRWSNLAPTPAVDRSLNRGKLAPWQLKSVIEYIISNLERDISLDELAAAARLSPFHFARAFRRSTGATPHRFCMELRVEKAQNLMTQTTLGLAEVALACGFAGQSHFTTAFKRHTGATPGAWRATVRS